MNRKDAQGTNVFEGGFLGFANVGPIDRSAQLPVAGVLEQPDGTAWMAKYSLDLLEMALVLADHDQTYEEEGFYCDVLAAPGNPPLPLRVRSVVGLIPLAATTVVSEDTLERLPEFAGRYRWFVARKPQYAASIAHVEGQGAAERRLFSIVSPERLGRILEKMLDETDFLSDHGIRALAACHRDEPFTIELGPLYATVDYEPGESTTGLFGGNSNWRGPVWLPVNYVILDALRRYARYFDGDFLVELPSGSGNRVTLLEVVGNLARRRVDLPR